MKLLQDTIDIKGLENMSRVIGDLNRFRISEVYPQYEIELRDIGFDKAYEYENYTLGDVQYELICMNSFFDRRDVKNRKKYQNFILKRLENEPLSTFTKRNENKRLYFLINLARTMLEVIIDLGLAHPDKEALKKQTLKLSAIRLKPNKPKEPKEGIKWSGRNNLVKPVIRINNPQEQDSRRHDSTYFDLNSTHLESTGQSLTNMEGESIKRNSYGDLSIHLKQKPQQVNRSPRDKRIILPCQMGTKKQGKADNQDKKTDFLIEQMVISDDCREIEKVSLIGLDDEAKVFLCNMADSNEQVVLKQYGIAPYMRNKEIYEDRFKEFLLLKTLNHKNIVGYKHFYKLDRKKQHHDLEFGIVMEYMDGGSLETYIEQHFKSITFTEKKEIIKQILLGLNYLHQNSIIHRDLKPGNILLSADKKTVKIGGFGSAKKVPSDSMKNTNFVSSNEVLKASSGEKRFGEADIWTLECCRIELNTGRKPYYISKPGNILLSADKKKINIQGSVSTENMNPKCLKKIDFVSTSWYMAPEVFGQEGYSQKADIWSLGCCVFQLITGQKPYHESNQYNALQHMLHYKSPLEYCSPEAQAKINKHEGMMDLLELCFNRDASGRPTASELLKHEILKEVFIEKELDEKE